ncbi:hypothetical protein L596_010080 [Steinernema carpocapsae]|uniref:Uncharacterized protein n=1 Tax=Steinernema carpocapsae TaxID=34508 RepID=A0A4U5PIK0_STECR|nr:hypothetical protein L596_010080 [Steinernema carpocapsae]
MAQSINGTIQTTKSIKFNKINKSWMVQKAKKQPKMLFNNCANLKITCLSQRGVVLHIHLENIRTFLCCFH